ncbi:MAG: multicopper oxidase domain-containing protein [Pseudomonadales bacterium]|nr:multicopper oxidase domain-containing protein [Pseudomonadales bacterium]
MFARVLLFLLFYSTYSTAATVEYEFEIDTKQINITGNSVTALAIADQIPAPTLRAEVGDVLRATFHNRLSETTSVHWHGILLPGIQDGVPYLNTQPIPPGGSHTFEFPILHAGTYWYHSHTDLQIQKGIYGALVLSEPSEESQIQDEVVLLSDWIDDEAESVLHNLKSADDFYAFKKDAVQSWQGVIANGLPAIRNRLNGSYSRMGPMDLADVGYDAFLVNGAQESVVELQDRSSDVIKLRLINGSTSSIFDVEYAGGPMQVLAADGLDIEPILVQRLRMSTAETYDVLVPIEPGKSFELRSTSFDGTGFSSLYVGEGERVAAPTVAAPNLYLMSHGEMDMDMFMPMPEMEMQMETEDHSQHGIDHSAPVIAHMMSYEDIVSLEDTSLPADQEWRDIELELTGNMERYVWSFNGKTASEDPQVWIRRGENVRFHLTNDMMMHHPLHLHGHFFRVVNRHGARSPLKHTVNVPPMASVIIEFNANESADWLFHCHNQFYMKTGMNRVVSYEGSSNFTPEISQLIQPYQRWFNLNEFHMMSSFMDYEFALGNERHEIDFELDADLSDTFEIHLTYNYHINRFVSAFAGVESREHHHEDSHDIAITGLNVTLPMLIDSEWRVDDHGDFRLELESEIPITKRFGFDWRWNTDNEYRYGVNYRLNNRWSITVHTDTEYGDGIGFQFFY